MGFFLLKGEIRTTIVQGSFNTIGVALFTIPALTLFHGGLSAVLGIWSLMFAASACYAMVRLGHYMPPLTFAGGRDALREQAWYGLKSGATSLAGFLNLRIDVFVIGAMLDARTLGIYSLAVATGELMWQLSRPLAFSAMGRVAAADREQAVALTCTITRSIVALEAGLGALLFLVAPAAIALVYGRQYAAVEPPDRSRAHPWADSVCCANAARVLRFGQRWEAVRDADTVQTVTAS